MKGGEAWLGSDLCRVEPIDARQLPGQGGNVTLPKGFGVLFESIPLETRSQIANLVAKQ